MLTNLQPSIREIVIVYGSGIILTILSIIFFSIRGYPLVSTPTETLDIVTPPLYMIPIFLPYGILLGEGFWMWNEKHKRGEYLLLLTECGVIGLVSFVRYIIAIPFSGHAILISFFLLFQAVQNRFQHILRFLIGVVVFFLTAIYKIFLWGDPLTFLLGALLGIILWLPGFLFRLKRFEKKSVPLK
ncbi:MAG: hypothetical protein ACFE8B_06310 [Candidatus Hermodarchaeota archaeon]